MFSPTTNYLDSLPTDGAIVRFLEAKGVDYAAERLRVNQTTQEVRSGEEGAVALPPLSPPPGHIARKEQP